jgi:hypothetical protein
VGSKQFKILQRQCKFQIKTEQIKSSKVFQKDKGPVRLCWYHIHVDPTGNESASNYFGRVWLAWCRRARHASLGAYSSHREEFLVASFPGSAGAAATVGAAPSHAAKSAVSTCNLSSIYTMSIYTIGLPNTGLAEPIFTAADNQIFFPF